MGKMPKTAGRQLGLLQRGDSVNKCIPGILHKERRGKIRMKCSALDSSSSMMPTVGGVDVTTTSYRSELLAR